MSKQLSKLKADAKSLKAIVADVKNVPASADRNTLVKCSGSLRTGQDVEYWFLAEYFLSSWVNWRARVTRYQKYFGQPPSVLPSSWRSLRQDCQEFAEHLWSKDKLDERLAEAWRTNGDRKTESELRDAAGLFHEIIASHHRLSICPPAVGSETRWRSAIDAATTVDREVRTRFDSASPIIQRHVRWHLSQFRRNTFDVSWLEPDRWKQPTSAYEYAARACPNKPGWLAEAKTDLNSQFAERDEIVRSLDRIATATAELGFYNFAEDIASDEMKHGQDSPVGTDSVQIVSHPSRTSVQADFMLAISRQPENSDSHAVLQWCIEQLHGRSSPSFVVYFTDSWNAPRFERQVLPDLQRVYDRGNRFLFLLVGSPDTSVSRIPLTLGTPEMASSSLALRTRARRIQLD